MRLIQKFNLILIVIFLLGLSASAWYAYRLTEENALRQVTDQAELIMQQALAVRSYSVKEVRPLAKLDSSDKFHPQTVPAYAATQVSNILRKKRPNYVYKEAVFNPTNPRDKASKREEKIINAFIENPDWKKQVGEITDKSGKHLYVAYPIKITNPACLSCHSVPANAPRSMLKVYGDKGGFGWKLNEIVGTQMVSVPFKLPAELAEKTFYSFITSLFLIFITLFLVLNYMIKKIIINPVAELTNMADDLSKGNIDTPEIIFSGNDEIASLSDSFNRMRRSVIKLLELIKY